ncbi:MAG: hypothetical protein AABZ32_05120 [Bacteroidota bacterium]
MTLFGKKSQKQIPKNITVRVRHCEGTSPEATSQKFIEIASPQSGLAMTMLKVTRTVTKKQTINNIQNTKQHQVLGK